MNLIKTKSLSLEQSAVLCGIIAKYLSDGDVIALEGDLGAGKTTLVSNVARNLGLTSETNVSSPTYVLHHIYPAKFSIHHLDLYRLETFSQIENLGFEEFLGKEGVTFIEWFEKFPQLWTGPLINIKIEIPDLEHRSYTFSFSSQKKCPDRWEKMLIEIQNI